MNIATWAETYFRHRDIFERQLVRIEREGKPSDAKLVLVRRDKVLQCRAVDKLTGDPLTLVKEDVLVTKNLRSNVEYLLKHWAVFAQREGVKIIFANTAKNEKWVLIPYNHNKLLEGGPAKGLWALFEGVPEG